MSEHNYIVCGDGGPLTVCKEHDTPRAGILMYGGAVTVFPNYKAARRAIERTDRYAKRMELEWSSKYSIRMLKKYKRC